MRIGSYILRLSIGYASWTEQYARHIERNQGDWHNRKYWWDCELRNEILARPPRTSAEIKRARRLIIYEAPLEESNHLIWSFNYFMSKYQEVKELVIDGAFLIVDRRKHRDIWRCETMIPHDDRGWARFPACHFSNRNEKRIMTNHLPYIWLCRRR